MAPQSLEDFVRDAERIYQQQLRAKRENDHRDEFVAIEPVSGRFFLGRTLSDALGATRAAYPDRLSHAMRGGHRAALHFGVSLS